MIPKAFIVSCEHAGNKVPDTFSYLFRSAASVLESHRGWDKGALEMANQIADGLGVACNHYDYTRLLIETNRSLHNAELFSEYSKALDKSVKQYLINSYYHPYRSRVIDQIQDLIQTGHQVIHISVHTFTPVWEGVSREVEIGLLFDDKRPLELAYCEQLKVAMESISNDFRIYHNQPYHGADDGFTTYLRQELNPEKYLGIEIEVNQKYSKVTRTIIADLILKTLKSSI